DLLPLPRLPAVEWRSHLALCRVPDGAGGDRVGSAEGFRVFVGCRL
ncbi:MAG: hypothetical protein AVDCRST_MAG78-3291, partial [uncultured Rubrobacteraceae bacterium]